MIQEEWKENKLLMQGEESEFKSKDWGGQQNKERIKWIEKDKETVRDWKRDNDGDRV